MKSKKILGLILILSMIAVSGVFAQRAEPTGFITSPTSNATAGRFSTNVDDYIATQWYTGDDVKFNNWFAFGSFASATRAALGYARNFGGIYVGLYYGGNLFRGYTTNTYTESDSSAGGSPKSIKAYTSGPTISAANWNDNRFAVLIGVADMGFRLSYASTHDGFKDSDMAIGANYYKNYKSALGWIEPQIQWGMAKSLLAEGIQPSATLDLGFFRNFVRVEQYTAGTWNTIGEVVNSSQNYFQPRLALNLGGYTFYTGSAFTMSADLDYTLTLQIYRNDYSYAANSTKTIKGINTGAALSENSSMENNVAPSLKASYTGNDKLGLIAQLYLPFDFLSQKTTGMAIKNASGDLWKNGADVSTFTFTVTPTLNLGLQYQILPSKLALNAGGIVQAVTLTTTKTDTAAYANDVKGGTSKSRSTTFTNPASVTSLYAGVSYNLSKNLTFDAVTGVYGTNGANIFGTGGIGGGSITVFGQILASLKF